MSEDGSRTVLRTNSLLTFPAETSRRFDGGVQVTSVSVQQALDAKKAAEEASKKVDEMVTRFSTVLDRLEQTKGPAAR